MFLVYETVFLDDSMFLNMVFQDPSSAFASTYSTRLAFELNTDTESMYNFSENIAYKIKHINVTNGYFILQVFLDYHYHYTNIHCFEENIPEC